MKTKAIANILIGIIVVAILGAAGYFTFTKKPQKSILPQIQQLQQNQQQETEQTTEQTNQTPLFQSKTQPQPKIEPINENEIDISNWKTYRNEKYGLKFKYPGDWILKESKEELGSLVNLSDQKNSKTLAIEIINKTDGCPVGNIYDRIELGGGIIDEQFIKGVGKLLIWDRGCYECYDNDPRIYTDGIRAIIYNSEQTAYVSFLLEWPNGTFDKLEDFFINFFLPKLNIDTRFNEIKCLEINSDFNG